MEKLNIGRDLARVAELLKEHGPIDTIGAPNLSGEFEELVGRLAKELFVEVEVSLVDILFVARLFPLLPKESHCDMADLHTVTMLFDIFGHEIEIKDQLAALSSALDRGILNCDTAGIKLIRENRRVIKTLDLAHVFKAKVSLSTYTYANIVRDEQHMYRREPLGFESNLEFLESWRSLMNAIRQDCDLAIAPTDYFFDFDIWSLRDIQEEFELIEKRLNATAIEIPFRKFADAFKLNREEQILVMYDVYHYEQNRYVEGLNHSVAFLPLDTPVFLDRPVLTKDSRLVKEGIFKQTLVESNGKEQPKYRLEGIFYGHILGDFVLRAHEPLV